MSPIKAGSLLAVIPPEIIVKILSELDVISLAKSRLVCRFFRNTVIETASLSYAIELAISGQKDGDYSILSPMEKLQALRNQQAKWSTLQWKSKVSYPMKGGGLWELFGNVLAQSNADRSISFVQLPSFYRGIPEQEWTVKLEPSLVIRDFGIDPSQDLLVLIEKPLPRRVGRRRPYRLHFRTMSTGGKHPLTTESGVIEFIQLNFDPHSSFTIQVSLDLIGVCFHAPLDSSKNEFVIWEWKTGDKRLHLQGDELLSFSFLSDQYVLFSLLTLPENENGNLLPELLIVDFSRENSEAQDFLEIRHGLKLSLPTLAPDVHPLMFGVRSDPSPSWTPHPSLRVPFHVEQDSNKIFICSLWLRKTTLRHLALVIPLRTLLSPTLLSLGPILVNQPVAWEDWGPSGTRLMELHMSNPSFDIWACYVYGTKFVIPESSWRTSSCYTINMFDFNPRTVRNAISQGSTVSETDISDMQFLDIDKNVCVTAPTVFRDRFEDGDEDEGRNSNVFRSEISTDLPYRWIAKALPGSISSLCCLMCSEDAVVLVDNTTEGAGSYKVYGF